MRAISRHIFVLTLCASLNATTVLPAEEAQQPLAKQLQPLAPYVGKTFKGEFATSTPEEPVYDVQKWERALNGRAVRILHSVNDGQYGGETIVMWDAKQEEIAYWYFTTAGFHTQGTMTFQDGKWISHEVVTGNENGVTQVKSTSELLSDGRMRVKSQYRKNGQWTDGHEIVYEEAPQADVTFK